MKLLLENIHYPCGDKGKNDLSIFELHAISCKKCAKYVDEVEKVTQNLPPVKRTVSVDITLGKVGNKVGTKSLSVSDKNNFRKKGLSPIEFSDKEKSDPDIIINKGGVKGFSMHGEVVKEFKLFDKNVFSKIKKKKGDVGD